MNTLFIFIFFNFFFSFTRGHAGATEKEEGQKSLDLNAQNLKENLITEYYDSGDFAGYIKQELEINGNEEPIVIRRYFYDGDSITVYDVLDNKTVYKCGEDQTLSSVENYDSKGNVITVERFFIEDSKLIKKTVEDGKGKQLICERYLYDATGGLIKKMTYSDIEELAEKIEDDIVPANEAFQYINALLKGEDLPTIQKLVESYLGSSYLVLAGYYNHPLEAGVFGFGEASDKARITFINGILNRNHDCMDTAQMLSRLHGGTNIHYIYRPTVGWANDLLGGAAVWFGSVTPQAHLLAKTWKELIDEMGGVNSGGIIIHYAHSIGASDTWNARTLLSEEEKNMIRVITIGSPFMIHKDGLHSVVNYVSVRDGVSIFSLLDPFGYFKGHYDQGCNVVFVGSVFEGLPLVEHPIDTPSYMAVLYKLGEEFIASFGRVQEEAPATEN